MAGSSFRRSFAPARSSAFAPRRPRSRYAFVKHRALCLAALVITAGQPRVSPAAVDMTGDWYVALGDFGPVTAAQFTQTGTSLQASIGGSAFPSGTIDIATGAFNLDFPFMPPDCGGMFQGQVGPTGDTFTAIGTVFFTPPDCHSIFCACSGSGPVTLRGSRSPCGDGIVDVGELCDNANLGRIGDCCALGCTTLQPAGQACTSDGIPCTNDICDALGTCTHPTFPDGVGCSDGLFCNGQETGCQAGVCQTVAPPCPLLCDEATDTCLAGCPPTPQSCRAADKSILLAKNTGALNDKLLWKWIKGAPTSQAEFGDPTAGTDYALCIFHAAPPTLIAQALVPVDATKWSALGASGYKYNDAAASGPDIDKILLKGSTQNKSKVRIENSGGALPGLPLSVIAPLTVQLVNGTTGLCWGATYTDQELLKNDAGQIKAKAP